MTKTKRSGKLGHLVCGIKLECVSQFYGLTLGLLKTKAHASYLNDYLVNNLHPVLHDHCYCDDVDSAISACVLFGSIYFRSELSVSSDCFSVLS